MLTCHFHIFSLSCVPSLLSACSWSLDDADHLQHGSRKQSLHMVAELSTRLIDDGSHTRAATAVHCRDRGSSATVVSSRGMGHTRCVLRELMSRSFSLSAPLHGRDGQQHVLVQSADLLSLDPRSSLCVRTGLPVRLPSYDFEYRSSSPLARLPHCPVFRLLCAAPVYCSTSRRFTLRHACRLGPRSTLTTPCCTCLIGALARDLMVDLDFLAKLKVVLPAAACWATCPRMCPHFARRGWGGAV